MKLLLLISIALNTLRSDSWPVISGSKAFIITSIFELSINDKERLTEKMHHHPNIRVVKKDDFYQRLSNPNLSLDTSSTIYPVIGTIVDGYNSFVDFFHQLKIKSRKYAPASSHELFRRLGVVFVHRSPFYLGKTSTFFFLFFLFW
jgi:hypothetical protein